MDNNYNPDSWIRTSLGDISVTSSGGTPSRSNKSYYMGSIPWIKSGELNYNTITSSEEYISHEAVNQSSAKLVPKGSLLIALYGATVGRLAFLGTEAATNQAIAAIKTFSGMPNKYLYYLLLNRKEELLDKRIGGAQPNISQTILKELEIPLPPLNEQHRIVDKIEELFSELDHGVANLKLAQRQLKVYRQALLKHAFEGKLTEQWRQENNPEPAEKLLERIQAERENRYEQEVKDWEKGGKKGGKPKATNLLPRFESDELATFNPLPSLWIYEKLGNLTFLKGGITKGKKLNKTNLVSLPYLRVANVQDGYLDLSDISYITTLESDLEKYKLEKGDILYTEGGDRDKLGRGTIWKGEIKDCIHQNHIFRARPILEEIRSEYIGYYSQSKQAKDYFFSKGKQTTNLASINLTVLSNLPIPLASIEETVNIVNEIESQFSVADNLEKTIQSALQKSEALRQAILKKAFEGKLVPQDPTDEPASELLKRIQAEKKAYLEAEKQGKKRKPAERGLSRNTPVKP